MARTAPDPPPPFDSELALRLYRRLGSFAAVARQLGCAGATVSEYLRRRGIRPPSRVTRNPATLGIYTAWRRMIRSCRDRSYPAFALYGRRGIDVCALWEHFEPFRDWSLRHGWKPGRGLLLIDQSRGFSPRNCRWAERREQLRRRYVKPRRPLRAFGEKKGLGQWARDPRCRVTLMGLAARLDRGWHPEDAISLPPRDRPQRLRRHGASGHIRAARRKVNWSRVERLVLDQGLSIAEVARRLRVGYSTVYGHFRRAGIPVARNSSRGRTTRLADGPLYGSWCAMRMRATQGRASGRSQLRRIAPEWRDYEQFRAWALASGYRRNMCLVRLDSSGDWEPANCRFVPRRQLPRYHRPPRGGTRHPRWLLEAWNEEKGPTEWSRDSRCAVTLCTVLRRLRAGWSPEDAIETPPQRPGSSGIVHCPIRAFGKTKSVTEWSRDKRCVVTHGGLRYRLARGVAPETAITTPPWGLGHEE